jgi:hypothetical protein
MSNAKQEQAHTLVTDAFQIISDLKELGITVTIETVFADDGQGVPEFLHTVRVPFVSGEELQRLAHILIVGTEEINKQFERTTKE